MDPLVASSWISGGSGLLGGLFGYLGQRSANKAMLQATRETNEQNYQIWQEQQQHNIDMFNMNNEYNDPSAQRARLEKAGYNPMTLQGTGNISGSSSAPPQSAPAPTMQAPPADAFTSPAVVGLQMSLDGLEKMSQMLFTNQQTASENTKLPEVLRHLRLLNDDFKLDFDMKNWYKTSGNWYSDISNNSKATKATADIAFNNSLLSDLTFNTEKNLQEARLKTMNATLALTMCDVESKQIVNSYLDEQQQQSLALAVADVALKITQKKLTEKEIDKAVSEIAKNFSVVAYNNSLTRLNIQQFDFNSQMNPLLLEGQKLHNEGLGVSNALGAQSFMFNEENNPILIGINKSNSSNIFYNNELLKLQFQFSRKVLPSMIKASIGEYEYKALDFETKSAGRRAIKGAQNQFILGPILNGVQGAGMWIDDSGLFNIFGP